MLNFIRRFPVTAFVPGCVAVLLICGGQSLVAKDYFLTLGGGYSPEGNQASLEENVVFFQTVLSEKHLASNRHDLYFADGDDEAPDLQVMADQPTVKPNRPATELLTSLHRRRGAERVEYRNHRVRNVRGPLNPSLARESLESIAKVVHEGDRLIVYVTAHGSEGPEDDEFDTTIDCWDEKMISAREFGQWMDALPPRVPVVMVMAQCYCGGFARTIFEDLDSKRGLSPHRRVGFFAQQHNLPAQGCRPDIEHDQEFSSYFWGAMTGRSRVGTPIKGCDLDGNGVISFSEAYAYAVWAGETIDIPLTTSDILLRKYSRLSIGNQILGTSTDASALRGSLQSYIDIGRPMAGRIVTRLGDLLGFKLKDDASAVVDAYNDHWKHPPAPKTGSAGRRALGASRRELLREVTEKWPELGDRRRWEDSPLLKEENQQQLFAEIKELDAWRAYDDRRRQIDETGDLSEQHELREVKYRRLIKTLELIILEQNLPRVAAPEIVQRYRQMIALEDSTLGPSK